MAKKQAGFPILTSKGREKSKGDYKFLVDRPDIFFTEGQGGAPGAIRVEMRVYGPKIPPDASGAVVGVRALAVIEGDAKQPIANPGTTTEFEINPSSVKLHFVDFDNSSRQSTFVVEFDAPGAIVKPIENPVYAFRRKKKAKHPRGHNRKK